jgi:phage gpG-like protein
VISVILTGDAEVRARFQRLPQETHARIAREMTRVTIDLQNYIRSDKLSGQVLKNRTGTLRRSINQRVDDSGAEIVGIVGANMDAAKYAAAHEYGFAGTVTVRAYQRRITEAFGRRIAPREVEVGSHSMRMNLPERSYLRSALNEKENEILDRLRGTVGDAVAA